MLAEVKGECCDLLEDHSWSPLPMALLIGLPSLGEFAFFSLFHLGFVQQWGQVGHCLREFPASRSMQETPQPSHRHHWRGSGPEHRQLLLWKDPKASLVLKPLHGPLSHPISTDAPGNIGNAIRKWVAKQQRRGLPLHPRYVAHLCLPCLEAKLRFNGNISYTKWPD